MIKLLTGWKTLSLHQEPDRSYFIFLLTLVNLLLFGLGGIGPLLGKTRTAQTELREGVAYERALARKIAALEEAKKNLANVSATQRKVIKAAIPDDAAQAALIEELSLDGGRTGFTLTAVSFRNEEAGDERVTTESFGCTFKGSPTSLINLLKEIAKGRLILIESLRLSRQTAGTADNLEVSLVAKSFYCTGN